MPLNAPSSDFSTFPLKIRDVSVTSLRRIGRRDVDGFIFVSRQLNTKKAVVVFNRARPKFAAATYTPLQKVPGLAQAKSRLGIVTIGP